MYVKQIKTYKFTVALKDILFTSYKISAWIWISFAESLANPS